MISRTSSVSYFYQFRSSVKLFCLDILDDLDRSYNNLPFAEIIPLHFKRIIFIVLIVLWDNDFWNFLLSSRFCCLLLFFYNIFYNGNKIFLAWQIQIFVCFIPKNFEVVKNFKLFIILTYVVYKNIHMANFIFLNQTQRSHWLL